MTAVPAPNPTHLRLALVALAIGGFAIGTTEFATMGLLPQIADGAGIDIPTAGHVVSAYALGVVVGAPLLAVLTARRPRREALVGLMVLFAVAHVACLFVHAYVPLLLVRFLCGLPHGAYFGLATLAAASLVEPARRTWAVAMVLMGLTVANIAGVPVVTWLGQRLGWASAYAATGVIAAVCAVAVRAWLPATAPDRDASMARELTALRRPQVWLALGIGTVGFGGMFSTYSYITPTLTHITHLDEALVPIMLSLYGIGSTIGTLFAGRVARLGLLRGIVVVLAAIACWLALFGVLLRTLPTAVVAVLVLGALPSMLVPMLQTRLMDVASDGQALAAALNHSTLNIANALGAWLGSVVLAAGWGYEWPSRVGALLAVAGIGVTAWSAALQRRTNRG